MLQPAVKLRPFFWTKLPANKVNIWSRVQPPSAELQKGQMAALEQLFAQTESRVTPGKKKGAAEGDTAEALLVIQHFHLNMFVVT